MNDHDLLIRLDTKVQGLIEAVNSFHKGVIERVALLEKGRCTKQELEDFQRTAVGVHGDMEKRIRSVEKFTWIAVGIVTIIQIFAVPLILNFLK